MQPRGYERDKMLKDCGKKCFLGPRTSFPICTRGTCDVNDKGLQAAYYRAKQWGKKRSTYKRGKPRHARRVYTRAAERAEKMLKDRGAWWRGKGGRGRSSGGGSGFISSLGSWSPMVE